MTADCLSLEEVIGGNSEAFNRRRNFPKTILPALRRLSEASSAITSALKINSIQPMMQNQRAMFLKERHIHGKRLVQLANLYFRLWKIPIRFWQDTQQWRDWEIKWFKTMNGDQFDAVADGSRGMIQDKVPGKSLWDHLEDGTLTARIFEAAARELHRAHQFWSEELNGPWSHGDVTATNVIYDETSDRARLIDFETYHDESMPAVSRHADDLLTLLLDIMGHVSSSQWLNLAIPFLKTYQDRKVITELRNKLVPPRGLAWIWWEVRTGLTNPRKITRRLDSLSCAIIEEGLCEPDNKPTHPFGDQIPEPAFLTPALVRV